MKFNRLYGEDDPTILTKGFPDYLKDAVCRWIVTYVKCNTPSPAVLNYLHTNIDNTFNSKICSALHMRLGNTLEEHIKSIIGDDKLIAEYVNYLLQCYPDETGAQDLEDILATANSEYKVRILRVNDSDRRGVHQSTPDDVKSIHLEFRTPDLADKQLELLENRSRLQKAWNDFYDVSRQDYLSVVQKSLDELAGAIRDRLYPSETMTNLSDYAKRIEQNIATLNLPAKNDIDWVVNVKSLAKFVNKRGVHNSGTDSDPSRVDAMVVLHLSVTLITLLRGDI